MRGNAGVTHCAQAHDAKRREIILIGGFALLPDKVWPNADSTDEVYAYSIPHNTWRALPPIPKTLGAGGAGIVDDQLHYFGGARLLPQHTFEDTADHWVLDLADPSGGWQPRAPISFPRNHIGAAVLDGLVYTFGGQLKHDENKLNQRVAERYDPATDAWTPCAPLPYELGHLGPAVVPHGHGLLIVGGVTNNRKNRPDTFFFVPDVGDHANGVYYYVDYSPFKGSSIVAGMVHNQLWGQWGKYVDVATCVPPSLPSKRASRSNPPWQA